MEFYKLIFFILLIRYDTVRAIVSAPLANIFEGNGILSDKLYQILAKNEGNVLYSPFSAHAILSLVYQGATGSTAKSFRNVLGLLYPKTIAKAYQKLMKNLNSLENISIKIVNKVFIAEKYKLKDEFTSIATSKFLTKVQNVDFQKSHVTAKHINDWIEKKTRKKITNLVSARMLGSQTQVVLVGAIYYIANWQKPFDSKLTKEDFHLSETDKVKCEMMHMKGKFEYSENADLGVQVLKLPYENTKLSLFILLPKSPTDIQHLESNLETKGLNIIYKNLSSNAVKVSLPKFKIEKKVNLKDPLDEMGMGIIFADTAEFPNMVDSVNGIEVSEIIQKVFINVSQTGTEAVGATGEEMGSSSLDPSIHFRANHPFIFALTYEQEYAGMPLLVGKLARP